MLGIMAEKEEQIVKNSLLFISIRENIPFVEKLVKVRRCLDEGADVNAEDCNHRGNRPLHLAARRGEVILTELLLNRGADVNRKNWNGQTALDIAQALHSDNKIVDLLVTASEDSETVSDNAVPKTDRVQIQNIQSDQVATTSNFKNNAHPIFEYMSRDFRDSDMRAQLHYTKLGSLILIRMLNDRQVDDFIFGPNILGDRRILYDICLRYRVKGQDRPVVLFVQAIPRKDSKKQILGNVIDSVESTPGDSFRKYFESYLLIKDLFRAHTEDPIFEGDFHDVESNFVIYTPTKDCFVKKNNEHQVSEKLRSLINTGKNNELFQYDYNDDDVIFLAKMMINEELKKLGAVFTQFIMEQIQKKDAYNIPVFFNIYIAKYHVAMGQEVLQEQGITPDYRMWTFRPEFFENKCEHLDVLRSTIVKEISTKFSDRSEITEEDVNNIMKVVKNPTASIISKFIGKLAIYEEETEGLKIINKKAWSFMLKEYDYFKLCEYFIEAEFSESVVFEAVQIKLSSMTFRLPLAFGKFDIIFNRSESKIQETIEGVAKQLIELIKKNKGSNTIAINNAVVKPSRMTLLCGLESFNGDIGSAVGNLLVLDPVTKMLKFDLNNKLPNNAAILLKELKDGIGKDFDEKLSSYQFKINFCGIPKFTLNEDEYDKRQVRDFLGKLWFYTKETSDKQVDNIIKNEIGTYYKSKIVDQTELRIQPDDIKSQRFHDKLQKWWKQSSKVQYSSQSRDYFNKLYLNRSCNFIDSEIIRDTIKGRLFGNLYKTKLLCMVYIRGLKDQQIENFHFGNNIRGIGDMDDICLLYRVKGRHRPIALFIQVTQKSDYNKEMFNADDLLSAFSAFNMQNFYKRYSEMEYRFRADNKDPCVKTMTTMCEGNFSEIDFNFVIYMPGKIKFTMKKVEYEVSEKLHYLINTGTNTEVYQYDYDGSDIDFLTKVIIKKQLTELGAVFLKMIMPSKSYVDNILVNKLITRYHVVMGRDVLQLCEVQPKSNQYNMWAFKSEFFKNDCEYLKVLKTSFLNELSNHWSHSLITEEDKQRKLLSFQMKLPIAFGNLDMTFRGNVTKVQRRIKTVADKLLNLCVINEHTNIVDINDNVVGPGKYIEKGIIDINGGIGGAVGNLLVLDSDTKLLKFDLENKALPKNATLFLNELLNSKYKPANELGNYRFRVNIGGFPKVLVDDSEYDRREAKDFLKNLWFYTNQATEDDLECIVKDEINSLLL